MLSACGGGGNDGDGSDTSVAIYTATGAVQCTGGGAPVSSLKAGLLSAGLTPSNDGDCGNDGLAHVAMCGTPDGSIAIFDVPTAQLSAAQKLGYAPLSSLPQAQRTSCASR